MTRAGDTIVEVLLATVVLSIVLAGAFSLSNKAIQTGQSALERTEAVNLVRDYAESLQFIHSTEAAGYDQAWQEIVSSASSTRPQYSADYYCDVSVLSPKYLDLSQIGSDPTKVVNDFTLPSTDGQLQYAQADDNNPNDLYAVWIEAYNSDPTINVIDIHIRVCWDRLGGGQPNRVGAVVRLSETRDL